MDKPLISVITVVYNARPTLEATIKSVLQQPKGLYEYWIIDGGSTDGSLEVIRQYEDRLAGWISEPDKGIYEAMNKGIDRANGKWLYFLGADDKLSEDILNKVSSKLTSNYAVVYGDVMYDTGHKMHSRLGYGVLLENTLHHQGAFYNQNLFNNFRYDVHYRVSSDYELNLRTYLQKLPTVYIPHIITVCGSTGASSVLSSKETNHLRGKYIKNSVLNYIFSTVLNAYYIFFKTKKAVKHSLNHFVKIL